MRGTTKDEASAVHEPFVPTEIPEIKPYELAIKSDSTIDDEEDWESLVKKTTNLVQDFEDITKIPLHQPESTPVDTHAHESEAQKNADLKPIESNNGHDPSRITASVMGSTGMGKSHQIQENIFITLANRGMKFKHCNSKESLVKALEINQSLSNRYLEDVTSRYLNILKEIKTTLVKVEQEHVQLSKAIHDAAKHGASMQRRLTLQVETEVERRAAIMAYNYTKEIAALKDQIVNQEADRRNEIYTFVIIGCVAIYFFFHTERQRSNQFLLSLKSKLEQAEDKENSSNASLLDLPAKLKKKTQKEIKRAKSLYQFKRPPSEAPV